SADSFQFMMTEHHAILDGWSVASLLTELFTIYTNLLAGKDEAQEPLATSFRDYVDLELQTVHSQEARGFWERQLDSISMARLPWSRGRHRHTVIRSCPVPIDEVLSQGLQHLAHSAGVSVKSVLLAAHMRAMALISGQTDVTTGLVSNGRPETTDGERVLGLFLNTLPFR